MSEYMDETSLTDEEIAEAIAAAKRAKAARKAKAAEQKKPAEESKAAEPEAPEDTQKDIPVMLRKSESGSEESSKELFHEIDQTVDEEENLSPKMRSAKSFSNAFAAAKNKREEELKRKRAEKEAAEAAESEAEDHEDEEPVFEEEDDASKDEIAGAFEAEESDEEIDDSDFDIDDEEYEETNIEGEDYEGVFEPDEEEDDGYAAAVEISENENDFTEDEEENDDDNDDDDDDDDEGAFSTKTKVIIGIIIALLIVAIVAAGIYFFSHRDNGKAENVSSVAVDDTVKSIKFKEPSMSLRVGESKSLEIIIEPEGAADKVFKLKSNDPAIAKVDEKGVVTGVASGNTTITATLKNNETITASLIVNVIDEKQNTINVYNKFVNSIVDGSTDIDSDSDTEENPDEETDSENEEESDTDSEQLKAHTPKNELSGSIIKDLDSDGELELALYYKSNDNDSDNVRIFYLGVEGEEEEEPEYDELGNPIETEEDTASEKDTSSDSAPKDKVLKEIDEYEKPERFSNCYAALDGANWNTCLVSLKEDESAQAKVTILSEDYTAPTYVYECEDTTIATVDDQGNIKGLKPGVTFVTVTSQLNPDAIAKIKVKVKDDTDLLEDYLAQVPTVNNTNDSVIPTETLTAKAITDLDGDGVSELLLRFNYGNNVETINIVKVENDQCIVYKTYNNISDLYEFYEGDGSYKNQVLIHYTTGKVCLQYSGTIFKENSKTKTTEQRIYSVEDNGSLSELVNFSTTTDISTKTVTSEIENPVSSEVEDDTDSTVEDTDSETYYDPDEDENDDGYDDGYQLSYAAVDMDEVASGRGITFGNKTAVKKLPAVAGAPEDEDYYDENDYEEDYESSEEDNDEDTDEDDSSRRTVTTEIQEESTKYFVNGTPVEKSVYEEYLSTYSSRYSVWNGWESV